MENKYNYPANVIWVGKDSGQGFMFNNGSPKLVMELQEEMKKYGYRDRTIICMDDGGNIYYTPRDDTWTPR